MKTKIKLLIQEKHFKIERLKMKIEKILEKVTKREYAVTDKENGLCMIFSKTLLLKHREERVKLIYQEIDGDRKDFNVKHAIKKINEATKQLQHHAPE